MMKRFRPLLLAGLPLVPALGMGAGELDASFTPLLERVVTPGSVRIDPEGNVLLGGPWEGLERIDGMPVGDRILLDADGTVRGEPAPGLLDPADSGFVLPGTAAGMAKDWFPLGGGAWLIPASDGGWLKCDAAGSTGRFFSDVPAGQTITPQFADGARLWVLRGGATRTIEVRDRVTGAVDPSFVPSADWPALPLQCVPAPGGGAWVMGGDLPALFLTGPVLPKFNTVFRIAADGTFDGVVSPLLPDHYLSPQLLPAGDGYRLLTGNDRRGDLMWPRRTMNVSRLAWMNAAGGSAGQMTFVSPLFERFVWAENEGAVLATGSDGRLMKYSGTDMIDASFSSPGRVSSVLPLPGGKWLVDGTRRLLADGSADPSWHIARPVAAGQIRSILPLDDGRMLLTGRFSSVQGHATRDLAILNGDGGVDASFTADEGAAFPMSAVVSGGSIYVVTQHPVVRPGRTPANLVKLDFTGAMDMAFDPGWSTSVWPGQFRRVFARQGGGIIAEKSEQLEVFMQAIFRMDSTGAVLGQFPMDWGWTGRGLLGLADGGLVAGPRIYGADGTLIRQVGGAAALDPVCAWQGGILFSESIGGSPARRRLRLWRDDRWVPGFAAEPFLEWQGIAHAAPGAAGDLYLRVDTGDGGQGIRRMRADGSIDPTFVPPSFTFRPRREAGDWKIAGTGGLEAHDPSSRDSAMPPAGWAYHPGTSTLWVGGSFNLSDGSPRSGFARLAAGEGPPAGGSRTAYQSWVIGRGPGFSAPLDDEDGDGIVNALEFLFGTDPGQPSAGAEVGVEAGRASFSYPLSLEAVDSTRIVEFSEDLVEWIPADAGNATFSSVPGTGDGVKEVVSIPLAERKRLFFRLRAEVR